MPMPFWVYLLQCSDGSFYTGHTDDLERRIGQHEQGLCCDWTRRRRPVRLVWADSAPTHLEALEFERRVKRWSRAKKIAMIEGDWARVGYYAKPPHERPSTTLGTNGLPVGQVAHP
jgi:predicted GIY-YIG superfamily endonuclease